MKKVFNMDIKVGSEDRLDYPNDSFLILKRYVDVVSQLYSELTPREKDVVTCFLYLNNLFKSEQEDISLRWERINGREGRDITMGIIGITNLNLNNIITNLRKKSIFVNNRIIESMCVYFDSELKLEFNFEKKDINLGS